MFMFHKVSERVTQAGRDQVGGIAEEDGRLFASFGVGIGALKSNSGSA